MKMFIYIVLLAALSACSQTPTKPQQSDYSGTYTGLSVLPFETFDDTRAFKVEFEKQSNLPYKATYTLSNESTSSTHLATCSLAQDVMTCSDSPNEQSVRTYEGIITPFTWSGTWTLLNPDTVIKGTFSVQK